MRRWAQAVRGGAVAGGLSARRIAARAAIVCGRAAVVTLVAWGCGGQIDDAPPPIHSAPLSGTASSDAGASGAGSNEGGSSGGSSSGGSSGSSSGGGSGVHATCAPLSVPTNSMGATQCLVLVALSADTAGGSCSNPGAACDTVPGLFGPSTDPNALFPQSVLDAFCAQSEQADASQPIAPDQPVCARCGRSSSILATCRAAPRTPCPAGVYSRVPRRRRSVAARPSSSSMAHRPAAPRLRSSARSAIAPQA